MQKQIYIDEIFDRMIYSDQFMVGKEFDGCTFTDCDFTDCDFSNSHFQECNFVNCNMAMIQLKRTCLATVCFKDCKLVGVHFGTCDDFLFHVNFDNCILDYSSFVKKKMSKTIFFNSSMREVLFSETILTGAKFENTDLERAVFDATDLREANFVTARNYKIDPTYNKIKKAKFSLPEVLHLLAKFDIIIE